jgi:radical SAM superfamily enzyme YgiQ (UPF0313 family)
MSIEKSKEEIIKEVELLIIEHWDFLDRARNSLARTEDFRAELKKLAEKLEMKAKMFYMGLRIELLGNELKKKTGGKT